MKFDCCRRQFDGEEHEHPSYKSIIKKAGRGHRIRPSSTSSGISEGIGEAQDPLFRDTTAIGGAFEGSVD